jgi:hypothetical protein
MIEFGSLNACFEAFLNVLEWAKAVFIMCYY